LGIREFVFNMNYLEFVDWDNDTSLSDDQFLSSVDRHSLQDGRS
jgi:hypothetical protein